ncbi:hypothetical protein BJ878DRAFT_330140 [Calycina marina]|uniref:SMP-30/Gluconolactonase/LRE-like region domain-containing protein n=1 Tax=Calycina marina TaxID=1763456 RepID=A0A9P8CHW2_9HELO|nr:hypothetical protein BJ878DRAFT_330140 [Calycina marina]
MSEIQRWEVKEPWMNIHCSLGEGPYLEPATNTLRFVDIIEKRLHTVGVAEGLRSLRTLQFDQPVGVTADIEGVDPSKRILVGGKTGIFILERETGKLTPLTRFYDTEDEERDDRMRSNDGAVDPQGRFWVATMNDFHVDPMEDEGILYRFNSDVSRHALYHNLKIPNSIGWSRDQKTMYLTHSTARQILAFDYAPESGSLSNERVFWSYSGSGEPDGFKLDVEGNLWSAIYGDAKVVKISPEGKTIGEVSYPTNCITCPVFVGTELWVTTAKDGDEKEAANGKLGGAIYKIDVGVGGARETKFKLDE